MLIDLTELKYLSKSTIIKTIRKIIEKRTGFDSFLEWDKKRLVDGEMMFSDADSPVFMLDYLYDIYSN